MIKAKFKGESGYGFIHGHTYNLYTTIKGLNTDSKKQYIWVYTDSYSGNCPYESVDAFLKNWDIIKVS